MKKLSVVLMLLCSLPPACSYTDGQLIRLSGEPKAFEAVLDALIRTRTTATILIDKTFALTKDRAGSEGAVPRNVTLRFLRGNVIHLHGHILEINGVIEAGPYPIFDLGTASFADLAGSGKSGARVTGHPNVEWVYPQWWGAKDDASADASTAFQAAINLFRSADSGQVGFTRTIRVRGKFLIRHPLNVTKTTGIKFVGGSGKNQHSIVYAHTGGVLFDCTGSHHIGFRGFYIRYKSDTPDPSTCAILLASCKDPGYTECLYNEIAYMYIEMFRKHFRGPYGTVGVCGIGTEENTFLSNQIYCDTPVILSAYAGAVKQAVPPGYATLNPAHSSGVNTFSGENMLVTWNYRSYHMILCGVNTVSLGNIYFGNMSWAGTKGNTLTAIRLSTAVDVLTGNIKMEGKTSLFDIVGNANISSVSIRTELGGSGHRHDKSFAVVNILGDPKYGAAKLNDFNLSVTYPDFEALGEPETAKSLFGPAEIVDPTSRLEFHNSRIVTNQKARFLDHPLPARMMKAARNVEVSFRDKTFRFP